MPQTVRSRRNTRPIRLLRAVVRAHQAVVNADTVGRESFGLPTTEFDLIATLGNTEGLRMCDLAARMLTSPPNVTRAIKKLEAQGLVERTRSPQSDREVIARLTPAGEALFARSYPAACDRIKRYFDGVLSADEQTQLTLLLERFQGGPGLQCPNPTEQSEH